ncbi:chemotaxis protein CheW [Paraburkholderia kururiensis]|uniref:Chemotaxis protein CheW n=1 Tax=Paraburkholderia kururiensis TaxID=984307 RepID=A0ABZ0WLJ2_9BURK|nr:chemotaxis protein CheW [Paraburkholderia kururiensis]WQD78237.1 chemotaxis protein CheW [Paraburkholderia kururiensis]
MNQTLASGALRAHINAPETADIAEPAQVLTFMLAGEAFGIGILSIKEIISYTAMTTVPMMPAFARGVINLRGAVVPVMDLLARFGKPSSEVTKRTCIVIVEVQLEGERQDIGIVVDAVNEVLDIPASEIEPPPSFGSSIRTEFIQGMGKVRGKFVILLALQNMMSATDMAALQAVAETAH